MSAHTDMFYVIYSQLTDLYVNDDGYFCSYESATQYGSYLDAIRNLDDGLRVVGPCIEGECP